MRSVSLRLVDLERKPLIPLGFEGENEYMTINFDCKIVFDKHPAAVPTLAVTPPQGDSYPAVVVRDGDIVSWTVCDSDLVYPGEGELQLTFVDGTIIGKTYKARTKVLDSITPSGEAPTPIQNWLIQAAAALQALPTEVSDAVVALMGAMVGVGETLDPDDDVTVNYDPVNNTLTIGVPHGRDGVDGHTPAIAAEKVGKVATFYVDGVAIATISDGTDGDPTALIDDTSTALNRTWSAKKISDENLSLKTEINSCLENTGVRITSTNKSQYFSDCNDAPNNSIYEISNSAQMANSPMGYDLSSASGVYSGTVRSVMGYPNGTLYTFKVSSSTQQFFITNNSASRQIIWFRIKYSSTSAWTDWKLASNVASTSGANFAIRKKFIAPYLDGQGNPTATDTGTPNPQYIADDPFVFNDFDNAPRNSIYQIDLDCDESVMAHNPAPGKSSILITTNFAWDYSHGEMQMCVGLDGSAGSTSFMFWRYGYYGAGQVYHFTPWSRVATEVPWELIREDTFTNATEADHIITADANNNAFDLTDVVLMFETPKQNNASGKGDYGAIRFYYSENDYVMGYPGAWTQNANANANGTHWIVENKNGLVFCEFTTKTETATAGQMRIPYKEGFTGSAQGIQPISNFSVSKINIRAVTGTGHYKLYGKRKPT